MELIAKDRDRLLHRSARAIGISATVLTYASLSIPGVIDWTNYLASLLLAILMVFCLYRVGSEFSFVWVLLGLLAGLGALTVAQLPIGDRGSTSLAVALVPLAGGAIAAFAIVLTGTVVGMLTLLCGFASTIWLVAQVDGNPTTMSVPVVTAVMGWVLATFLGFWLSSSVPRAARRIYSIGRAHRAERQASEIEAQRRQSARLLHDTVLATLTLFAHSGVGVTPEALRQQAGEDAHLLRQLRLGAVPVPQGNGTDESTVVVADSDDATLGTTLESVKQRFGRMGLEVSWHGTGQVLLPGDVLDAFLMALAECLENVRRHSGVTEAHVTITDDETTVRAMVTDSGVGFNLGDIDSARLGLKESVIARLGDVGGNARLFSSPGSGTTVVLEVPK